MKVIRECHTVQRNVACDHKVMYERERQDGVAPGSPCQTPPLRLQPALLGTRVGRVHMQWQEIKRIAPRTVVRIVESTVVKVESDADSGAAFQRKRRVVTGVAAEIEYKPGFGGRHEVCDELPLL